MDGRDVPMERACSSPAAPLSSWFVRTPRRREAQARAIATAQHLMEHESRIDHLELAFNEVVTELKSCQAQRAARPPPGLERGAVTAAPAGEP